jgi:hypothetical protein
LRKMMVGFLKTGKIQFPLTSGLQCTSRKVAKSSGSKALST